MRCLVIGLLLPLLFQPLPVLGGAGSPEIDRGIYTYQKQTGEETTSFLWQIEEGRDAVVVSLLEGSSTFVNYCASDGTTLEWRLSDEEGNRIVAYRQDNFLHIAGVRAGEPYRERVEIDGRPWFQPLSYSLGGFLSSDEEAVTFWTIRTDTMDPVALAVKKIGDDEIDIQGEPVPAQKVEVRAEGFFSSLWHGSYWYRKSDNLFLMYRSVHGLPGTAETVVTLVRTPAD